jgi:general nucleoside transport system ATP-binding protein
MSALSLSGVTKRYGDQLANDGVALEVAAGSVHAVVGENGAGKSTLLQIAYGTVRADAGQLQVRDQRFDLRHHSPLAAIGAGIGMVHQHFMLVPTLRVVENVVLGREPRQRGRLDLASAARDIAALGERFGLRIDPWRRVEQLTVGEQQRVELIKVLWRGADTLLLDEPTAVLAPTEVDDLFGVLRTLVAAGKSVVLVSHKLDEVNAIADAITVMRRGQVVARMAAGASPSAIAAAMVGADAAAQIITSSAAASHVDSAKKSGEPVLAVRAMKVARSDGSTAVDGVSFELRPGEVLGIAGVQGNGQSELALALAGLAPVAAGQVLIASSDVTAATPATRRDRGLGHIPEDRLLRGLVPSFDLAENALLGRQHEFTRSGLLAQRHIADFAAQLIAQSDVRPPEPALQASSLSGGNQQKLVVGRELSRPGLRVLLCAEPTRGVDVAAAAAIHQRIRAAIDGGVAALIISSDLAELRRLCDRVAVMYRGRFAAVLDVAQASDRALGALMTGVATAAASAEVAP